MNYTKKSFSVPMGSTSSTFADRWEATFGKKTTTLKELFEGREEEWADPAIPTRADRLKSIERSKELEKLDPGCMSLPYPPDVSVCKHGIIRADCGDDECYPRTKALP